MRSDYDFGSNCHGAGLEARGAVTRALAKHNMVESRLRCQEALL